MKTQCPECGAKQNVPESYINKEISCSKCKRSYLAAKIKLPLIRRRTAILIVMTVLIITLILGRYYGFYAGWERGHNNGYNSGWAAGYTEGYVDCIAKEDYAPARTGKNSQSKYNSTHILSSEPGQISSPAWKVLESDSDFWTISWQFKFDSHISSSVWPIFYFYDIDGFLLQECSVIGYLVEVAPSQTYSFTGKELISKEIASRIAYSDAIVKKMDF